MYCIHLSPFSSRRYPLPPTDSEEKWSTDRFGVNAEPNRLLLGHVMLFPESSAEYPSPICYNFPCQRAWNGLRRSSKFVKIRFSVNHSSKCLAQLQQPQDAIEFVINWHFEVIYSLHNWLANVKVRKHYHTDMKDGTA